MLRRHPIVEALLVREGIKQKPLPEEEDKDISVIEDEILEEMQAWELAFEKGAEKASLEWFEE